MKRFKNILTIYDDTIGSDDALGQAFALARANSARLSVVSILPDRGPTPGMIMEIEKRLRRLVAAAPYEGVPVVETGVLTGTPYIEIIRHVMREEHDLVIASAEGGNVIKNTFFGSTSTHLMRKCPCPVWVVKPAQEVPYARILAAIDPNTTVYGDNELTVKVMDLATSLARSHGAQLHILHAWDVEGEDRDTINSEITEEIRQSLLEKHWDIHRNAVLSLLEGYPMSEIDHEVHLPKGQPQTEIIDLVHQLDVDLIVMGTVSRGRMSGLLLGSTAETVLDSVRCGVITVKPEGFLTPVKTVEMSRIESGGVVRTSRSHQ